MKKPFRQLVAVFGAVSLLAVTACSRDTVDSPGASDGAKEIVIGQVSGSAANPAVQVMNDAMTARAEEAGVKLLVETSENVEEQITKAEAMIAQGVTYLGLHPWDGAAVTPLIRSASQRGVKVVILIDGVPGVVEDGTALTFISGNELAAAEEIGKAVAQRYPGPTAGAIITGTPGNLSADNRTNGFKNGIKDSQITVAAEATANWARDQALRVAGDMLTANPELRFIFANNDEMAFGARAAIMEAGKSDTVATIGWNGTCAGLAALLKGEFLYEAVLPFDEFGAGLIDAAVDDAAGRPVEKSITPEVPILDTEQAKAILDGSAPGSDALKAALKAASENACN
ncbi:sugar ABC transporter substrate-binding protein [Micromonospora sp. FIMYZ51]|uniref:sugar ABC transporter substrate-binding protein n=1 Tax=Micromonospora sp. FIMYZ51 TaxID=3051832 RepID=UPI00311FE1B6